VRGLDRYRAIHRAWADHAESILGYPVVVVGSEPESLLPDQGVFNVDWISPILGPCLVVYIPDAVRGFPGSCQQHLTVDAESWSHGVSRDDDIGRFFLDYETWDNGDVEYATHLGTGGYVYGADDIYAHTAMIADFPEHNFVYFNAIPGVDTLNALGSLPDFALDVFHFDLFVPIAKFWHAILYNRNVGVPLSEAFDVHVDLVRNCLGLDVITAEDRLFAFMLQGMGGREDRDADLSGRIEDTITTIDRMRATLKALRGQRTEVRASLRSGPRTKPGYLRALSDSRDVHTPDLEAIKHYGFNRAGTHLDFSTGSIALTDGAVTEDVGPFTGSISLLDLSFNIQSDGMVIDGCGHPHIDDNGIPCLGGTLGTPVRQARERGDVWSLLWAVDKVLLHYNPAEPFVPLSRWADRREQERTRLLWRTSLSQWWLDALDKRFDAACMVLYPDFDKGEAQRYRHPASVGFRRSVDGDRDWGGESSYFTTSVRALSHDGVVSLPAPLAHSRRSIQALKMAQRYTPAVCHRGQFHLMAPHFEVGESVWHPLYGTGVVSDALCASSWSYSGSYSVRFAFGDSVSFTLLGFQGREGDPHLPDDDPFTYESVDSFLATLSGVTALSRAGGTALTNTFWLFRLPPPHRVAPLPGSLIGDRIPGRLMEDIVLRALDSPAGLGALVCHRMFGLGYVRGGDDHSLRVCFPHSRHRHGLDVDDCRDFPYSPDAVQGLDEAQVAGSLRFINVPTHLPNEDAEVPGEGVRHLIFNILHATQPRWARGCEEDARMTYRVGVWDAHIADAPFHQALTQAPREGATA